MRQIASETGLGLATVARILKRSHMNRLKYSDHASAVVDRSAARRRRNVRG